MTELTNIYWILCIWLVLLQIEHSRGESNRKIERERERNFLPGVFSDKVCIL